MNPCATPEEKIKCPEKGGAHMPFINIKLIEGVLSDAQKQEMIKKVTDAAVSVEGENLRSVTWCVLEEVISGDWGIGGKGLTTADVKALAAGKTG
jgi:4-oxalocrotonate tautomerase